MDTYSKVGRAEQDLKWARIWFKQFSVFHHRRGEDQRPFTADEVVAFLQSKRDAKVPAWKRMKIIEALMTYRLRVQKQGVEDLVPLQKKMEQIIEVEHAKNGGFDAIDGVVGIINPLESDAIQAFRRALRTDRSKKGPSKLCSVSGRSTCRQVLQMQCTLHKFGDLTRLT